MLKEFFYLLNPILNAQWSSANIASIKRISYTYFMERQMERASIENILFFLYILKTIYLSNNIKRRLKIFFRLSSFVVNKFLFPLESSMESLLKFSKYSPSLFFLGHAPLSKQISKKSSEWIGKWEPPISHSRHFMVCPAKGALYMPGWS